jgi:hypothetical protein
VAVGCRRALGGSSLREIAAMKSQGFDLCHYGVDKIIKAAAARERKPRAA